MNRVFWTKKRRERPSPCDSVVFTYIKAFDESHERNKKKKKRFEGDITLGFKVLERFLCLVQLD